MADGYAVRRNEDGPEVWVEAVVDAPPARVWELVADPATAARFSPELFEVEWIDGATEAAVGARFIGRNRMNEDVAWETTSTITELEPGRVLRYAVNDVDDPVAVWTWELEAVERGTRLRHHARLGPGRSGLTWAIRQRPDEWESITRNRLEALQRSMRATVDGVAELAAR